MYFHTDWSLFATLFRPMPSELLGVHVNRRIEEFHENGILQQGNECAVSVISMSRSFGLDKNESW